jgi:hypothetical protein
MRLEKWGVILFCFLALQAEAQVFDLNPPSCYTFEPVFKGGYVAKNRIRSIHASIVYKRDNEAIQDKGLSKTWEYDSRGLLTRYYFTTIKGFVNNEISHPAVYRRGRRISAAYITEEPTYSYDTTFTDYLYNPQKQLILRRTRDGDYYNAVYYEYDTQGDLRKESVYRETNASENRNVFKLGVQNQLSQEEFRYEKPSTRQRKCKHLNDEGKVFKETIFQYDSIGHLLEENNSYTVSWMRSSTHMTYDKSGRMIMKLAVSNENGEESAKSIYKYTGDNKVDVEERFKGDEKYYELNYLYDKQTDLLTSHFIREELNKAIVIVKYSYEFY